MEIESNEGQFKSVVHVFFIEHFYILMHIYIYNEKVLTFVLWAQMWQAELFSML